MTKAGYDSEGRIQLFRRLEEMEKGRKKRISGQLLVFHPPSPDLIARVEEHI